MSIDKLEKKPKVLVLDIETKPAVAYVWSLKSEITIGLDQLISPSSVLCFGAKWFGSSEKFFYSEWEHGSETMIREAHKLMSEADAIVTYNGDRFDIPKLTGEFVLNGLEPPPPLTSIDIYKTVRKLGLTSSKLAFVGPYLSLGKKKSHEGFTLWSKVIDGDEKARKRMKTYCLGDVILTDRVYRHLRPFIRNHPHLGMVGKRSCGACGSSKVHSRGYRRTKAFRVQSLQCQDCGSWFDGVRSKM